jgi:hypothetical protein
MHRVNILYKNPDIKFEKHSLPRIWNEKNAQYRARDGFLINNTQRLYNISWD